MCDCASTCVCVCVCVFVGASSLRESARCHAVLPQVPVKSHSPSANQQHAAAAARSLAAAGSLAQLPHRPAAQLHPDGQPTQPARSTDGPGQEPNVLY